MKNFQQNLLIILALTLCSLCPWQWYVQTVQRTTIQDLNQMVYDRNATIQSNTNTIATLNSKVNDMDMRITQLKGTVATNEQVIVSQTAKIELLQFEHDSDTNQIAQYKVAVDTLDSRLKDAYAGIDKQNEAITNLIAQRDDFVKKYNDVVTNRNDIVLKYNELVKQVEKNQNEGGNQ